MPEPRALKREPWHEFCESAARLRQAGDDMENPHSAVVHATAAIHRCQHFGSTVSGFAALFGRSKGCGYVPGSVMREVSLRRATVNSITDGIVIPSWDKEAAQLLG
jgi:hypothetical protein